MLGDRLVVAMSFQIPAESPCEPNSFVVSIALSLAGWRASANGGGWRTQLKLILVADVVGESRRRVWQEANFVLYCLEVCQMLVAIHIAPGSCYWKV